MGLSHGFQAHFVSNANYSTLIIIIIHYGTSKIACEWQDLPLQLKKSWLCSSWFFHLSPLESTALTTQGLNFSKQLLLWGQEYSKDCCLKLRYWVLTVKSCHWFQEYQIYWGSSAWVRKTQPWYDRQTYLKIGDCLLSSKGPNSPSCNALVVLFSLYFSEQ